MKNKYYQPSLFFQSVGITEPNNNAVKTIGQLKIFIADNDFFSTYLYEQHLKQLGQTDVHVFQNAAACVENLMLNPDIIFIDNDMETPGSINLLKKIKKINGSIHVVLISDRQEIEPAIYALKHGAFDYIFKNKTGIAKINKVLERLIEMKELIRISRSRIFKEYLPFV